MRVLVVGGAGYVASITLPIIAQHHTLRIFDLKPPQNAEWEYVAGNVGDPEALQRAAEGMDVLLYMAMGSVNWGKDEALVASFDVNVKGVYLALHAAHKAGITHAVYTSSMSVYNGDLLARGFSDEDIPPRRHPLLRLH